MSIPNFDFVKAERFVTNFADSVVLEFARLLYLRDVEGLPISHSAFLRQQEKVLGNLGNVMARQLETGGWQRVEEDIKMHKFVSTFQILIFFGYLGLNGTAIPEISKAVDYCFSHLNRDKNGLFVRVGYPEGAECENAMFLRALLKLGFAEQKPVYDICMTFLDFIYGREGMHCTHHRHLKGNPCIWVLIKNLMMLNEFPQQWCNNTYRQVVENIQKSLLASNLSGEDWFGRNWLKFGYFRSVIIAACLKEWKL